MVLTVHHMGLSQSERIIWLCEELGIEYNLQLHTRDPLMSPASLTSRPGNETGKSPFLEDPDAGITLSESSAISDYIIYRYGNGRLALKPTDKNYSDYLYWYHYANSTMQPTMLTSMFLSLVPDVPKDAPVTQLTEQRLHAAIKNMDDRLKDNKWLAGDEFTAAETMSVYSLTTQRYFGPQVSLASYPNLLRWLQDCAARPEYQTAMKKGDPEMELLLGAEAPSQGMMEVGGVKSDHWKKK